MLLGGATQDSRRVAPPRPGQDAADPGSELALVITCCCNNFNRDRLDAGFGQILGFSG